MEQDNLAGLHEYQTLKNGLLTVLQQKLERVSQNTIENYESWGLVERPARFLERLPVIDDKIEFLSQGQSVTATAMMLGYGAPSAFIEMFKAHFGQTPLQFVRASSP